MLTFLYIDPREMDFGPSEKIPAPHKGHITAGGKRVLQEIHGAKKEVRPKLQPQVMARRVS